ncbi:fasciclin domain-containing protein [Tropicimonas sp. TH_r6]|uniref:fasciclin domain-containing protein n=1 Tax=Tropicimonas sp. TH_r6 TaxID=3082085 RepID=UPI0029540CC7|nr:fasciclin domain-containing protein [Tropicimonas sp. TH_r6]MDV7143124.1 fasciclin domain-containing protein [Tropicimonas sp. TH_r6]
MANIVNTVVELSGAPGTTDTNGMDFDLLREAVLTAGLAPALSNEDATFTVFAPNDDAFIGLAQTLGYGGSDEGGSLGFIVDALTLLGGGDPIPLLQSILTYHVVDSGAFDLATVASLGDGASIATLQGGSVTLNLSAPGLVDLDPGLPDPNLIGFDVDGGNGIIHVLDGVLLPLPVSSILTQPGTDFIIGDDDGDSYNTGSGNDFIDGNGGADIIRAGIGNDVAFGGSGNDWISGARGNDILKGESGNDKIYGGGGNDAMDGGSGNDWMSGGRGADIMDGGSGRDKIYGGHGDDIIEGGAGNDRMIGGGGRDTFVFGNGSDDDIIFFFRNGVDKIDLSSYEGIDSYSDIEDQIDGGFFGSRIHFEDGDSVLLFGTREHLLDESDFIFAEDMIA